MSEDLVEKAVRAAAQKVHDINADIADFDGDRRGHYHALEQATEHLVETVLRMFPDTHPSAPSPPQQPKGDENE